MDHLPLSARHKELSSFIALSEGSAFDEIKDEMERKTTSLEEILGYIPEYGYLAELMRAAAGKLHGVEAVELHPCDLSDILENNVNTYYPLSIRYYEQTALSRKRLMLRPEGCST